MNIDLKKNTFPALLAGGVVVLIVALLLNYKATLQRSTEEQPSSQVEDPKIAIMEGEESKDWNLYTHKELGFSIKYPDDVIIAQETSESVVFTKEEYWNRIAWPVADLFIAVRDVEDNDPLTALWNETLEGNNPKVIEARINNAIGYKKSYKSGDNNFYLNDQSKIGPVLRVDVSQSSSTNYDLSDFILMLSTFRFER